MKTVNILNISNLAQNRANMLSLNINKLQKTYPMVDDKRHFFIEKSTKKSFFHMFHQRFYQKVTIYEERNIYIQRRVGV